MYVCNTTFYRFKGDKMSTISDIHSYTIFVNIDKRDGNIEGHQVILKKETMEAIEELILNGGNIKVKNKAAYRLEDDK